MDKTCIKSKDCIEMRAYHKAFEEILNGTRLTGVCEDIDDAQPGKLVHITEIGAAERGIFTEIKAVDRNVRGLQLGFCLVTIKHPLAPMCE